MSTTHTPGPALRRRGIRTLTPSELRVADGGRGTGTIPAFLRRFVLASVVAAAVTLGGSALGDSGIADAAPKVWDQAAYGACAQQAYDDFAAGKINKKTYQELAQGCCILSGGKWTTDIGIAGGSCVAPAAAPSRTIPPGVPKLTLTPAPVAPPLGDITQTFTPAPSLS